MRKTEYFISWQQSQAHPKQIPAWHFNINIQIKAITHPWNKWNWITAWMSLSKIHFTPINQQNLMQMIHFFASTKSRCHISLKEINRKKVCIGSVCIIIIIFMFLWVRECVKIDDLRAQWNQRINPAPKQDRGVWIFDNWLKFHNNSLNKLTLRPWLT